MNKNIVLLLLAVLILGCGKDDDDFKLEDSSATIKISPAETKWFLREFPDSIRIQLSGGQPPYVIKNRPSFSSRAIIRGNELHVFPNYYPNEDPTGRLGYDFINIADNVGNTNTFNIQVSFQEYWYTDTSYSIHSAGDTTIDVSKLKFQSAAYDGFFNRLSISYQSTAISYTKLDFNLYNIDSKGSFRPKFFLFDYYIPNLGIREYNRIDSNQVINITKFSTKEIVGNYSIVAKTNTKKEITLSGTFHLLQTGQRE